MGSRLYIGNLSWDTTEEALNAALSEGGRTVTDLHMVTDRETGRPRGFAFAEFANDAEAQQAIADLEGMHVVVVPRHFVELSVCPAFAFQLNAGCRLTDRRFSDRAR